MKTPQSSLITYRRRWVLRLLIKMTFLMLGPTILIHLIFGSLLISLLSFFVLTSIFLLYYKPWQISLRDVINHLDLKNKELEYSSGLILQPQQNLSGLATLQLNKIATEIKVASEKTAPPVSLKTPILIFILLLIFGVVANQFGLFNNVISKKDESVKESQILFKQIDSTQNSISTPQLISQSLTIIYPTYTNLPNKVQSNMSFKAVEGSRLSWSIKFDTIVKEVFLKSMTKEFPMKFKSSVYSLDLKLENSGFYSFQFFDMEKKAYTSDLFFMESVQDEAPVIEVKGVEEFASYEYFEPKIIDIKATLSDDFGLGEAYILATLSRGEGEAIQFREERFNFDSTIKKGDKNADVTKTLDLDQLKMEPGDELYFHIEVSDLKQPQINISRSETFFAVIRDTLSGGFEVEGNLGADLMPDYFRSQRQLIIDTEKLIKDKPNISEKDFKYRSNELGFDQKALRLKYGQFMGDEADSGLAINDRDSEEHVESEENTEEEDPLSEYTHDHDSEDHQAEIGPNDGDDEKEEDPLHDYVHDHSDPEASTLFEKSLKAKLREAMDQMWDSELYLRLYKPEESLPYQYKALRLIQEIKNSARIYVHRIGFDPPPIKEDKRLSGELENIGNFSSQKTMEHKDQFKYSTQAINLLDQLINDIENSANNQEIFEKAGEEIAILAIENPGSYLTALQRLKYLSEGMNLSKLELIQTKKSLFDAINRASPKPKTNSKYKSDLNHIFLKEVSIDD